MWRLKLIILLICLKEAAFQNSCNKHTTCSDCILDQNVCSWCTLKYINESRCMPQRTPINSCPSGMLQAPYGTAIENEGSESKEYHMVPQKYDIKLRTGQPVKFDFIYKITKNNPVDVYFLIDASGTMAVLVEQTANQIENIYNALRKMTNDVNLGFGTFVDKNTLPYVVKTDSEQTYIFKHNLSLTYDYKRFEKNLKYKSGSNFDNPEGGLDAICQAMACTSVIGWRPKSTKIIVYLSDAPFHVAGNGRMAGIFTPYDGKCHTVDNVYTKELEMDYPTIGMINKLAIENDIIILFAVSCALNKDLYKDLSNAISGSKFVCLNDTLASDDVITETLSSIYNNITSEVNLKVNMKSGRRKHFELTFNPDCTKDPNKKDIDKACKLKSHTDGEFRITGNITLFEYQGIDDYVIDITGEGFSDKLSLDVKVIKTCDCESKKAKSDYCNDEILECGVCRCSDSKYGEKCQCSAGSNTDNDNSTCIYGKDDVECSGHGQCDCGLCKCNKGFDGRYCECIKSSCEMNNGLPCGGEARGRCECGTCKCEDDYTGKACQCYKLDEACRRTPEEKICNGRGNCYCGDCKCNEIPVWDKRTAQDSYCTILPCPSCHNLQCSYIEACVLCRVQSTNVTCPCEGLDVQEVTMADMDNNTDWNTCSDLRVDVGCHTKFLYTYNDDAHRISLIFTKEKDCAETYFIIGGTVLASLLLIGILTLIIWKVTTELRYRREYTKFVEAHKDDLADTCDNPLYEAPTTYFRNPAFRKSVN